jgi:hypothetical protein
MATVCGFCFMLLRLIACWDIGTGDTNRGVEGHNILLVLPHTHSICATLDVTGASAHVYFAARTACALGVPERVQTRGSVMPLLIPKTYSESMDENVVVLLFPTK